MSHFYTDIKFGFRQLCKSPGWTMLVVVMLALGIGVNTGLFTVFEQLVLRSLPVNDPEELVSVSVDGAFVGSRWGAQTVSYPMFKDLRKNKSVFEGACCRVTETVAIQDGDQTQQAQIELVSGDFFELLGVNPAMGRLFSRQDETSPGANPVVVLTHDYWEHVLGSDASVIGRTLSINRVPMEVVGVAAQEFRGVSFDTVPKLFIPITMKTKVTPWWNRMEDRRTQWVRVMARLNEDVSREQAELAIQTPYQQILAQEIKEPGFEQVSEQQRERFLESKLRLSPAHNGHSFIRAGLRRQVVLLWCCAGLVLLVTCANIGHLLMSRSMQREREISVRLALGAGGWRVCQQLLTEQILLALMGGLVALGVAMATIQVLVSYLPASLQSMIHPTLNGIVVVFDLAMALITALVFGLLPAWRLTRTDLVSSIKMQASTVVGDVKRRLRQGMVVTQLGLSLMLLIGSGLLMRNLRDLYHIDPGFRTTNLISFRINPTQGGYSHAQKMSFCRELQTRLNAQSGVVSTTFVRVPLLEGNAWTNGIVVEGYELQTETKPTAHCNAVSSEYGATLGIPLRLGRSFNPSDELSDARPVVLVNEAFVRQYLPDRDPIGCRVGFRSSGNDQPNRDIVGVLQDAHYDYLQNEPAPMIFCPYASESINESTVYVRTHVTSPQIFQTIREQVRSLDASIPVYDMKTLADQLDRSLASERMVSTLASTFGLLATILATTGLYGIIAFSIANRTQEFGVRVALGAERMHVVRMILREGVILIIPGIVLGLAGAWATTRVLRGMLYDLEPTDPVTFIVTTSLLITVSLLACWIPAQRAAKIDPMEALRYE